MTIKEIRSAPYTWDHEAKVDTAATYANRADWSAFSVVVGAEVASKANKVFSLHLERISSLADLHTAYQVLASPLTILFFVTNFIKTAIETIHMKRIFKLYTHISDKTKSIDQRLDWLRGNYFPKGDTTDGEIRLKKLQRRFTRTFTAQVQKELTAIDLALKSSDPEVQALGVKKAEVFLSSLSRQARNRLIVHAIGILALSMSFLGMLAGTAHFIAIPFVAAAIVLTILEVIYRKRVVNAGAAHLQNRLAKLDPPKRELLIDPLMLRVALVPSRSLVRVA